MFSHKYHLVITVRAKADIRSIIYYTALNWGNIRAVEYRETIYDLIDGIIANPKIGFNRGNFKTRIAGKHLIYYRITKQNKRYTYSASPRKHEPFEPHSIKNLP